MIVSQSLKNKRKKWIYYYMKVHIGLQKKKKIIKLTGMNYNKKKRKQKNWSDLLKIWIIFYIILLTSTALKAQSYTDSTAISYYSLNEFAKFVDFKPRADSLIAQYRSEIKALELVSSSKDELLIEYEKETIPSYLFKIKLLEKEVNSTDEIITVKEDYFKQEKKRLQQDKLKSGLIGVSIGVVLALLLGG